MDENGYALTASGDPVSDPLTDIIRTGARTLLEAAFKVEVELFVAQYVHPLDGEGRRRVVRNGYHAEREVQTGVGAVTVRVPSVRDRAGCSQGIEFRSSILPPYVRKTRHLEALLPWLYLKGISTGDKSAAPAALVGVDVPGWSAATIGRLKQLWVEGYRQWKNRSLKQRRYVYIWADGIHMQVRLDQEKQCLLVLMGVTADGRVACLL